MSVCFALIDIYRAFLGCSFHCVYLFVCSPLRVLAWFVRFLPSFVSCFFFECYSSHFFKCYAPYQILSPRYHALLPEFSPCLFNRGIIRSLPLSVEARVNLQCFIAIFTPRIMTVKLCMKLHLFTFHIYIVNLANFRSAVSQQY